MPHLSLSLSFILNATIWTTINFSSAAAFNFNKSKMLLTLPNDKVLDSSKAKAFTDATIDST